MRFTLRWAKTQNASGTGHSHNPLGQSVPLAHMLLHPNPLSSSGHARITRKARAVRLPTSRSQLPHSGCRRPAPRSAANAMGNHSLVHRRCHFPLRRLLLHVRCLLQWVWRPCLPQGYHHRGPSSVLSTALVGQAGAHRLEVGADTNT